MAADLGVPTHRVLYAIRTRKIASAFRVGLYRVFDADGFRLVGEALKRR